MALTTTEWPRVAILWSSGAFAGAESAGSRGWGDMARDQPEMPPLRLQCQKVTADDGFTSTPDSSSDLPSSSHTFRQDRPLPSAERRGPCYTLGPLEDWSQSPWLLFPGPQCKHPAPSSRQEMESFQENPHPPLSLHLFLNILYYTDLTKRHHLYPLLQILNCLLISINLRSWEIHNLKTFMSACTSRLHTNMHILKFNQWGCNYHLRQENSLCDTLHIVWSSPSPPNAPKMPQCPLLGYQKAEEASRKGTCLTLQQAMFPKLAPFVHPPLPCMGSVGPPEVHEAEKHLRKRYFLGINAVTNTMSGCQLFCSSIGRQL